MKNKASWRIRVLGWGNVAIGVATPINIGFNILSALQVFSVNWAGDSIVIATLLGSVLGYLSWRSGWSILYFRSQAFKQTCFVGGLTFGYTFVGILTMATSGRDQSLMILIRHGSENWWDWTLSHFQNSCIREIPLMTWWILGLGTVVRFQLPGAPERGWDRLTQASALVFGSVVMGGMARCLQFTEDGLLSSQR